MRINVTIVFVLVMPACMNGGIHTRGEQQVAVDLNYGSPSTNLDGFAPHGAKGSARNLGVTVRYIGYLRDRYGMGVAVTPLRWYDQADGSVYATELMIGLRYFPWEFEVGQSPVGLFLDLWGGGSYSSRDLPRNGTPWNFVYNMGLGFEWRATKKTSWIASYHIKHISNGSGPDSSINPSQNDHLFGFGFAVNW